MRLFIVLFLFGCAEIAFSSQAPVRLVGGQWDYEVSGFVRDDPNAANSVDFKNDLNLQDDKEGFAYLYIEHPIPVLPNFRIGTTALDLRGNGTTSKSFTYNGTFFPSGQSIVSQFDLSHQEVAIYYELIDSFMDLDLGINVKIFDGDINLNAASGTFVATEKFDETVPMLYVAANIPFGNSGVSISGDLSYIAASGDSFTDTYVRVQYTTDWHFGVALGYRDFDIDFEDNNEAADLRIKGSYLSLFVYF